MYFLSLQSLTRSVFATPPTQNQLSTRLSTRLSTNCRLIVMYLSCAVGLRLETPWIAQCSSRADQQSSHSQSLAASAKPKATHHILVLGGAGPARRLCGHAAKDFAHTSERSCYSKLGVPVNPHFTKKLLPPSSK